METSTTSLLWVTTSGVLGLLAVLFVLFTAYLLYLDRKYAHIPGPPNDNFYLGHIPTMARSQGKGLYTGHQLLEWAQTYGPLYKIRILHWYMLIPSNPILLKEFLTKSKYPKDKVAYRGLFAAFGSRFMGRGLISNINHAEWYQRRSSVNPAFHKRSLAQMIDKFREVSDDLMEKLTEHADGTNIKLLDYFNRAAMAALCKIGFGMNLNVIQDKDDTFPKAICRCLGAINNISRDPFMNIYPTLNKYRQKTRAAAEIVRNYGRESLKQRTLTPKGAENPIDILDSLIDMIQKVPHLEVEDLLDEFVTFFVAGQETTAATISFILNNVGRRPDILQRLYDEVDQVLGDRKEVTLQDISKLEFLDQCFKETLRLSPTAHGTVRGVKQDVVVDGFKVPAGSSIFVSFFIPHRKEEYFENPQEFVPDRWAGDYRPQLYTYSPFSMGPRSCVGQNFAMMEIKLFLARFFQSFEMTLDMHQDFGIKETLTLRPQSGCVASLRPRVKNTPVECEQ